MAPSPVVELNLAVAVAMADGPAVGLAMMDGLAADGALERYPYLHSARADLLRRLGSLVRGGARLRPGAGADHERVPERAFLEGRLAEVTRPDGRRPATDARPAPTDYGRRPNQRADRPGGGDDEDQGRGGEQRRDLLGSSV